MTDSFDLFLAAYPQRGDPYDVEATREAWRRAVARGADPEALIHAAESYARARDGQPARFTMSARRWLQEGRWRDAGPVFTPVSTPAGTARPALVWIALDAPGWHEWEAFYRATKGKTPPLDRKGGWRFPSRWPPVPTVAE